MPVSGWNAYDHGKTLRAPELIPLLLGMCLETPHHDRPHSTTLSQCFHRIIPGPLAFISGDLWCVFHFVFSGMSPADRSLLLLPGTVLDPAWQWLPFLHIDATQYGGSTQRRHFQS